MELLTTCKPHPEYTQNGHVYSKVYKVIESCETEEHAKVTHALMVLANNYLTEKQMFVLNEAYVKIVLKVTGII